MSTAVHGFTLDDFEAIVQRHQRDLLDSTPSDPHPRVSLTLGDRPVDPGVIARWIRAAFGVELRRVDPDALGGVLDAGGVLRIDDVHELHPSPLAVPGCDQGAVRIAAVARWKPRTAMNRCFERRTTLHQVSGSQRVAIDGCDHDLLPGSTITIRAGARVLAIGPTDADPCLHLEVTSIAPTVRDLLGRARRQVIDAPIARRALPPIRPDGAALDATLDELAQVYLRGLDAAAAEECQRAWRQTTAAASAPSLPWSATLAGLPPTGCIRFPRRPTGAVVDLDTLATWLPHLDHRDREALAEAADRDVALDDVLADATAPGALRRAIADLVAAGLCTVRSDGEDPR